MRQEISEKILVSILDEVKEHLLKIGMKNINSGEEFEGLLYNVIKEVCAKRGIREHLRTGKQAFPDMYIWPFGIEAKFTIGDSWVTTGNSIVETTRLKDLKNIYMFFCKKGKNGKSDIMFRPYQECLSDIVVTHSPRYKIDMTLGKDKNIFKKMGVDYETFCKKDVIKIAKDYYRKNLKKGEGLWWIDAGVSPVIKNFSDLDRDLREHFKIETMIYFPEIFSPSNQKYERPSLHLLTKYQATKSSFRDIFSASGREKIKVANNVIVEVPRILHHLYKNAKTIKRILAEIDRDELARSWGLKIKESDDVEQIWLRLVNKQGKLKNNEAELIYKAGLRAS